MTKHRLTLCLMLLVALVTSGCATSGSSKDRDTELTPGLVQKEIRKGMSQAAVAEALGSPNIVTRDDSGKETWIYDKMSSEASYKESSTGFTLILFGWSRRDGYSRSSQKTLTVIIKYNKRQKVDSFSFHSTKF